MDFLQKPLEWFSSFYIRVQSKICGRKSFFFILPFWIFPDFERKFFQTFGRKTSRICQNYLLRVQRNNLWLKIYFKSFKLFWIFCRNLWNGSQVSVYVSRVKFAEETVFWFFFSEFLFGFWAKIFSDFRRKIFKNCQNYLLHDQRNNLFVEIIFKSFESFWIFCRNLWHCSQVSIYVSRVKFAEEKVFFFILPFWIFPDFERKFFQTFGRKTSRICQNYLLRVQRNNLWLKIYFKSFKLFWIFCRNLWNGSQVSIYVSRVKFAEKNSFLIFLFRIFFRILSKNFFRLSAKNLQKVVKTTFCVTRGTICGLKIFLKVLNRFGFSAETFGMVLKFLYTCPE